MCEEACAHVGLRVWVCEEVQAEAPAETNSNLGKHKI